MRSTADGGGYTDRDGDQFFALRTFRRDGTAVSTPIWLAPGNGYWYAYTPGRSGKVRRIRRDPHVEVAPSDFGGEPQGPWRTGKAQVLSGSRLRSAKHALTAKYGAKFRLFVLVTLEAATAQHGGRAVGMEITFDDHHTDRVDAHH